MGNNSHLAAEKPIWPSSLCLNVLGVNYYTVIHMLSGLMN